jgi:hypothetical protein
MVQRPGVSYVRWKGEDRLLIVCNFDANEGFGFDLQVPAGIISAWGLEDGEYVLEDQLSDREQALTITDGKGLIRVDLGPLQSFIFKLQ